MNPKDESRKDEQPKRPGPPPKDERRETEERLAEQMGGREGRKAKDALKEDPSLPDDGKPGRKGGAG